MLTARVPCSSLLPAMLTAPVSRSVPVRLWRRDIHKRRGGRPLRAHAAAGPNHLRSLWRRPLDAKSGVPGRHQWGSDLDGAPERPLQHQRRRRGRRRKPPIAGRPRRRRERPGAPLWGICVPCRLKNQSHMCCRGVFVSLLLLQWCCAGASREGPCCIST